MNESTILKAIRLALNRTRRVRVVRNTVGVDADRGVRYGLGVGSADLIGMLPTGRVFAIEVKTPTGRLSSHQHTWLAAVRRWGGFAAVARSTDDALDALARAESGACE